MEVVKFKSPANEWDEQVQLDTVKMLKDWLEQAERGEFVGVAICGVVRSGEVQTNVADHNNHPALVGAVTILQGRLLRMVEPYQVN